MVGLLYGRKSLRICLLVSIHDGRTDIECGTGRAMHSDAQQKLSTLQRDAGYDIDRQIGLSQKPKLRHTKIQEKVINAVIAVTIQVTSKSYI